MKDALKILRFLIVGTLNPEDAQFVARISAARS